SFKNVTLFLSRKQQGRLPSTLKSKRQWLSSGTSSAYPVFYSFLWVC
ncbi:hypothetical protein AVEN_17160-1, partial [Araneus ventricosus]